MVKPRRSRWLVALTAIAALVVSGVVVAARPAGTPVAAPSGAVQAELPWVAGQVAESPPVAPGELSAAATRQLLRTVAPPVRDENDLARRFKQACGTPAPASVPLRIDEAEGTTIPFWVLDEPNRRYFQVQATLAYTSEHLLLYVQNGTQIGRDALASSAAVFEQKTWPLLREYFADLDVEPRLTVFNGRVPGVGGYFSASDAQPRSVNPYSNERAMVLMSLDQSRPGTPAYDAVLAHEAQHFVHSLVHPQQDSWINEGASELAMAVAGFDQSPVARSYLDRPETQLNGWGSRPSESLPHYGAGYLIMEYFAHRFGGYSQVKRLIASPGASVSTFDNYLAEYHGGLRFDDLFRDFVVANLLNDRAIADGRFGYQKLPGRARVQESLAAVPAFSRGVVQPYGTRYVELLPGGQRGELALRFEGSGEAKLFGGNPRSGRTQWWGNASDEMESTLTREFDLTGVPHATLQFASWFNTEPDYDYGGVAASTDGGCTWKTLPGRHTTDADPVGQNLGHGFTGRSGGGEAPVWVDEAMDLTPYAGQKVLLRFFYVTDQSYHGSGFAVDDVSIPEIGFHDDAEGDRGWQASGFLRSVNAAALDWTVQAVAFGPNGPEVLQLPAAPGPSSGPVAGTLTIPGFGEHVQRVVVIISPLVPTTLEPVEYYLEARLN